MFELIVNKESIPIETYKNILGRINMVTNNSIFVTNSIYEIFPYCFDFIYNNSKNDKEILSNIREMEEIERIMKERKEDFENRFNLFVFHKTYERINCDSFKIIEGNDIVKALGEVGFENYLTISSILMRENFIRRNLSFGYIADE